MPCLYCKKRLWNPFGKADFCSPQHEALYQEAQSGEAIRRLMTPAEPSGETEAPKTSSAEPNTAQQLAGLQEALWQPDASRTSTPSGLPVPVSLRYANEKAPIVIGSGAPKAETRFSTGTTAVEVEAAQATEVVAIPFVQDPDSPPFGEYVGENCSGAGPGDDLYSPEPSEIPAPGYLAIPDPSFSPSTPEFAQRQGAEIGGSAWVESAPAQPEEPVNLVAQQPLESAMEPPLAMWEPLEAIAEAPAEAHMHPPLRTEKSVPQLEIPSTETPQSQPMPRLASLCNDQLKESAVPPSPAPIFASLPTPEAIVAAPLLVADKRAEIAGSLAELLPATPVQTEIAPPVTLASQVAPEVPVEADVVAPAALQSQVRYTVEVADHVRIFAQEVQPTFEAKRLPFRWPSLDVEAVGISPRDLVERPFQPVRMDLAGDSWFGKPPSAEPLSEPQATLPNLREWSPAKTPAAAPPIPAVNLRASNPAVEGSLPPLPVKSDPFALIPHLETSVLGPTGQVAPPLPTVEPVSTAPAIPVAETVIPFTAVEADPFANLPRSEASTPTSPIQPIIAAYDIPSSNVPPAPWDASPSLVDDSPFAQIPGQEPSPNALPEVPWAPRVKLETQPRTWVSQAEVEAVTPAAEHRIPSQFPLDITPVPPPVFADSLVKEFVNYPETQSVAPASPVQLRPSAEAHFEEPESLARPLSLNPYKVSTELRAAQFFPPSTPMPPEALIAKASVSIDGIVSSAKYNRADLAFEAPSLVGHLPVANIRATTSENAFLSVPDMDVTRTSVNLPRLELGAGTLAPQARSGLKAPKGFVAQTEIRSNVTPDPRHLLVPVRRPVAGKPEVDIVRITVRPSVTVRLNASSVPEGIPAIPDLNLTDPGSRTPEANISLVHLSLQHRSGTEAYGLPDTIAPALLLKAPNVVGRPMEARFPQNPRKIFAHRNIGRMGVMAGRPIMPATVPDPKVQPEAPRALRPMGKIAVVPAAVWPSSVTELRASGAALKFQEFDVVLGAQSPEKLTRSTPTLRIPAPGV